MELLSTGLHIKGLIADSVQQSITQPNSLAFLDEDGVWIHISLDAVRELAKHSNSNSPMGTSPFVEG